jgi:glycosyltransferase involved in cell wall biosynthesis
MSTPAVSIIVPFYNPGEFLAEAIAGVFAQTYLDWELILVNDGSTDESVDTANRFVEEQPARVVLLSHEDGANHGLPATRNLGVRRSRGALIALLDADDYWFADKLQQQVTIMRENPAAGMVFGRSEYWNTWDPAGHEDDIIPRLVPGRRMYEPPELWTRCYPFGSSGSPCPSDLMIRRSVIDQVGGFEECFDRRYPTHEDIAFLSKIFLSVPVYVSDECWDRYRRHDESLWSVAQENGGEERSRAFYFEWMAEYLKRKDVKDEAIWELYRERSWRYRHSALSAAADQLRSALWPIRQFISRKG